MNAVSVGQYTFQVVPRATKKEVVDALKKIFEVDAIRVRMHVRPGKTKRLLKQRKVIKTAPKKFAIVILAEGQRIAGFDEALEVGENES